MNQLINKLSNLRIVRTKCPLYKKDIFLFDGGGLVLRIRNNNTKYWLVRLHINKKRHDRGIGMFPEISLERAREIRDYYKALALKGIDPMLEKKKVQSEKHLISIDFLSYPSITEQNKGFVKIIMDLYKLQSWINNPKDMEFQTLKKCINAGKATTKDWEILTRQERR